MASVAHLQTGEPTLELIGDTINISTFDQAAVQDTEDHGKAINTQRNYRNRIKEICSYLKNEQPEYVAQGGVIAITEEQKNDRNFFAYKNTDDLVYTRLNVKFIKLFMGKRKIKGNGKKCSHTHLRKFHDAILWGAEKANQALPLSYKPQMQKFLDAYMKETKKAKQEGQLDEEESDPIPFGLYQKICEWSLQESELFVWVFTVFQWNCIARSVSIDPLGFHNLSPGEDSIRVTYDLSKMDQGGKNVCPKNIFANPHNPSISFHFALAVWLCLHSDKLEMQEKFFASGTAGAGQASQNYNKALTKLLAKYEGAVREFVRINHCNSHGNRKGGAIHVTTSSTAPPPTPSVLIRGDWSMGKILDIYWKFGDAGDCYAGRILAGLPCDAVEFESLPPHFGDDDDNGQLVDGIMEGICVCFGVEVVRKYKEYRWLFQLLLASVVYHIDYVQELIAKIPSHPFAGIPLLQNSELLQYLAKYVTTKPSSKMNPTGVPPHVKQLKLLSEITQQSQSTLLALSELVPQMEEKIKEAIENAAINMGNVTPTYIETLLKKFSENIEMRLESFESLVRDGVPKEQSTEVTRLFDAAATADQWQYCYGGRFYSVPKGFELPQKQSLRNAFGLWINGDPVRKSYQRHPGKIDETLTETPIKPFRLLDSKMLPKDISRKFRTAWVPALAMMTDGIDLPKDKYFHGAALDNMYKQGLQKIKGKAAYIFENGGYEDWTISTWSRKVQRSAISKSGTESDKANLDKAPVLHQHKRKRKEKLVNRQRQQLHFTPSNEKTTPATRTPLASHSTTSGVGYCAIRGCKHPSLNHDHPCYRRRSPTQKCPYYVHNFCAQENLLTDSENELNMYCSAACLHYTEPVAN